MKASQRKNGANSRYRYRYRTSQYNSQYFKLRYAEVMVRLRELKVQRGCYDCGYREHHAALQFDHLPGNIKLGSPTTFAGRGWKSVVKEIEKCDVVCANCHCIRTWTRAQEPITPKMPEREEPQIALPL